MDEADEHPVVGGTEPHSRLSPSSSVSLPDELSRRLNIGEPMFGDAASTSGRLGLRLFCEERHDAGEEGSSARGADGSLVSKWRQKEKLKTTAVALVLCLNIGVDPPDVIKISPCARLECWVDPLSMQPAKALETIGKNLQAQYERWQPRAKYRMHLDPTVDDVKKLCVSCRRTAKNERVLFHYNGHGVPRPTVNGEIWVFNSRYTQYIPLSMYELQSWLGTPCIYVMDCSNAGLIINSFKAFLDTRAAELRAAGGASAGGTPYTIPSATADGSGATGDPMRDMIILAACGAGELLPQNPDLPADVFTACLTTPIKVALRWFCSRSLLRHDGVTKELIDRIPGRQTDRKTPLGELNWIFTAITDTIAWNSLPRALFQKLFRQDLLVASLFRNFLLAERIMAASNCTPVSYPRLPPTHQHPMWQAWDMAAEMCLLQLPALLADPTAEFTPSSFFSEQLTAFELWLAHGAQDKKPPEQLPIVLQVLLSQVHRLRALVLLGRFLDMGSWAVDLALSVGIFPYVLKLLQTTSCELRTTLVFIWAKILALDRSCQGDLVKDGGQAYFIKYLDAAEPGIDAGARAQAVFVLATVCDGHPKGQALCAAANLHSILLKWLRDTLARGISNAPQALLLKWLCLCLGKLCDDAAEVVAAALREGALELLSGLLLLPAPELRAAAVFALGCLVSTIPVPGEAGEHTMQADRAVADALTRVAYDASPLVRAELAVALARFMCGHSHHFGDAVALQQRKVAELLRSYGRSAQDGSTSNSAAHGADANDEGVGIRRSASYGSVSSSVGSQQWRGGGDEGALKPGSVDNGRPPGDASMHHGMASSSSHAQPWSTAADGASIGDSILGYSDAAGGVPSDALYSFILETVLMLATDPSPKVAKLGRKVLRITQCELAPLPSMAAPRPPASHAPSSASAGASPANAHPIGSAGGSAGSVSSSLGSLTQKFVKTSRSWRSGFAGAGATAGAGGTSQRTSSAGAPTAGAAPSVGSASPESPSRSHSTPGPMPSAAAGSGSSGDRSQQQPNYSRAPYMLRCTVPGFEDMSAASAGLMSRVSSSADADEGTQRRSFSHLSAANAAEGYAAPPQQQRGLGPGPVYSGSLPASPIFKLSCERFSRPMLEPQASAWRELEGVARFPWTAPPDMGRRAARARDIETAAARCRAVRSPSIRQQVNIIETHADALSAVVFHSFHLLLVSADNRGFIRVNNGVDGNALNTFHVTNGAGILETRAPPPTTVTYMRQLNETDSNLLLACSADGAVRVWRSYLHSGNQRLATAWQSVPIHQPPLPTKRPAAFELCAPHAALFAAGGSHPDALFRWDMVCQMCTHQISVRSSSGEASCPVAVERLSVAASDPDLLLTSCSDRFMRVFDVRAPGAPVATIAAGRSPLVGVVLEPCGRQGTIVTGSVDGDLRFLDLRMATDAAAATTASTSGSILTAAEVACVNALGSLAKEAASAVSSSAGSSSSTSSRKDGAAGAAAAAAAVPPGPVGRLTVLAAHPHAPLLATGTSGQEVRIWNADTCEAVGAVRLQSSGAQQRVGPVTCMAWHPYNLYLGAGGRDSAASVYIVDSLSARLPSSGGLSAM